jgi:hypothetical protein
MIVENNRKKLYYELLERFYQTKRFFVVKPPSCYNNEWVILLETIGIGLVSNKF